MLVMSWNVNGIRAVERKDVLLPLLKKFEPDVLCIQETKAQPDQITMDFGDYHVHWHSAEKKGYSGVGILSKIEPLSVAEGLPEKITKKHKIRSDEYGDPAKEGRVIAAEFDKLFVVSVYTPNAKDDLSRIPLRHKTWDPAFLDYMKELERKKPVVFCGDLNVAHTEDDLARPKPNEGKKGYTKEEREGFQNYLDNGFVDTFRVFTKGNGHYTWWTHWGNARANNVGWRIDYCVVSDKLKSKVKAAEIHAEIMGSDHCPISVQLAV